LPVEMRGVVSARRSERRNRLNRSVPFPRRNWSSRTMREF
jgi:hypothetical protein